MMRTHGMVRRALLCLAVLAGQSTTDAAAGQNGQAASVQDEVVTLTAEDGGNSWGVLYTPTAKAAKTAVIAMHPQGDQSRHNFLRPLAEAGFAAFGQTNRNVGNDTEGIHEEMVLDIAAGITFLKGRGYQKIVLMGISGGGSLMAFYQAQAVTAPPGRVKETPAGNPPDLNKYTLPAADGALFVIPHLGEGKILEARIDPSVMEESNLLSVNPALDMYNPANGFRYPPGETHYSKEFIETYKRAQHERMERLDRWARAILAEEAHFAALQASPSFKSLPAAQQHWIARRASARKVMSIYRTAADLRYTDLSLDPSDRLVGNNASLEPWIGNYHELATPSFITPRAFLSSRSSISSNAVSEKNMPLVTVPAAIIQGTAHRQIYPSDTERIFKAIGAKDKELFWIVGGDVSFRPSGPKAGAGKQRDESIRAAVTWVQKRFP